MALALVGRGLGTLLLSFPKWGIAPASHPGCCSPGPCPFCILRTYMYLSPMLLHSWWICVSNFEIKFVLDVVGNAYQQVFRFAVFVEIYQFLFSLLKNSFLHAFK